jgi:putative peptide zinc metalloprotease protein
VPAPVHALEIILPDQSRIALVDELTIGRAAESVVRLADPTVSRVHAVITAARDGSAVLSDAGSSFGTWLDGRRVRAPEPLHPGSRIRLGDAELVVDRRRGHDEAGHTLVVPQASASTQFGQHPRVRSGYALKRLEAAEGDRRWVLKDLRSGRLVRLSSEDAELFALLDGSRSLATLVGEAEQLQGQGGPARLTLLLAALGARGFMSGAAADERPRTGRLTRQFAWTGAGERFERLYRGGGRALLTRRGLSVLGAVAAIGLGVFAFLVVGRYGTPFVVAHKVGLGALVFVLGRLAVAAVHETAHGLVMASFGRRVREAGLKLVLIFPYVYVNTSEAWFEPRRHRIAITAAGPVSDFSLGALFALCCLALPAGTVRDIFFQLAFGAYLGGLFNLNPFVERDGYQILVDVLREPGLRRRAREQLFRRLSGGRQTTDSRVLTRYAVFGVVWSALAACFAIGMSLRYEPQLVRLLPAPVVWGGLVVLWLGFFLPVIVVLGRPAYVRRRQAA